MISVMHIDTGLKFRGGQRQVDLLIRTLAEFDISQYLACPSASPLVERAQGTVKEVVPISASNLMRLFDLRKLRLFVKENNINIIHAHCSHAHGLAILIKRRDSIPKLIVTRRSFGRIAFGSKSKYCDHDIQFIAVSDHVKEALVQGGVKENSIKVISSMLDLSRFEPVANMVSRSQGFTKKTIVSAGVFDKKKGFWDALQAIEKLSKGRSDFRYILYGDGPQKKRLAAYISDHRLSDVISMPGWHDRPAEFLKSADIYLMPSYTEGIGMSIVEAMAAGVPVVISDIPSHRGNVSDGINGLLFPPGDITAMAEKLEFLLDNPQARLEMGEKALAVAGRYDFQVITRRIYDVYLQLVAAN